MLRSARKDGRARPSGRHVLTRPILVGVVGAPHGVKGEVRVRSFTAEPEALGRYGALRAEGRADALLVRAARPIKDDMLVVRFEGVASREAAASLTGTRLFIDRAALPQADEDEFYHADLIGLRAETEAGDVVGQVRAVVNYGAGDVLDIASPDGETVLVAFTRAFVPRVDVADGRVVIAPEALAVEAGERP